MQTAKLSMQLAAKSVITNRSLSHVFVSRQSSRLAAVLAAVLAALPTSHTRYLETKTFFAFSVSISLLLAPLLSYG